MFDQERLFGRWFVWFGGSAYLTSAVLSLFGPKDQPNLVISLLVAVAVSGSMVYHEWKEWKRLAPERAAREKAQADEALKKRLQGDVALNPEYARHVLECVELGLPFDPTAEQLDVKRKARARVLRCRHFGLPDDADSEALRRKEEEEYRWLRNRDQG
jgi:hypothetical protein